MKNKIQIAKLANLSAIVGGMCGGIFSLFVTPINEIGLDSMQIGWLRMTSSALELFIILFFWNRELLKIRLKDCCIFIGSGICGLFLMTNLYITSVVNGGKVLVAVLIYTAPAFVLLFSSVFFREKITGRKLLALFLIISGAILISGYFGGSRATPFLMTVCIGSAVAYSVYQIFCKVGVKKYDPLTVTTYSVLFAAVGMTFFINPAETAKVLFVYPKLILYILGMSLICTVLAYFLINWALKHAESGKVSVLAASEVIVATLVGIIVYHEKCGLMNIAGMLLIMLAIVILNLPGVRIKMR